MHSTLCRCLLFLSLPALSFGQVPASPLLRVPPTLPQITKRAGTIFSGRVVSIQSTPATSSDQVGSVQVTFQVEQAIRGVRVGQTLTIHEWAGLWTTGERYSVGERLLLFLYAPSAIGLTSPVGGAAGRFLIEKDERIQLSTLQAASARETSERIPISSDRHVSARDFTRSVRRMARE
jgi:hypothetical protein